MWCPSGKHGLALAAAAEMIAAWQTVGMGSNNIQMVDTRTWEPPSWIRAFLRALVAVLTSIACWLLLVVAFSDAP